MDLKISLDATQVQQRLGKATQTLGNPVQLLTDIGGELEKRIRGRFETKTDASGAPWKPHAASTLKAYAKKGIQPSLLVRSGHMLGGVAFNVLGNAGVEVGMTNQTYAGFHVTGTRRMPRRDALFATINASLTQGTLGKGDEEAVLDVIEEHLRKDLGL